MSELIFFKLCMTLAVFCCVTGGIAIINDNPKLLVIPIVVCFLFCLWLPTIIPIY